MACSSPPPSASLSLWSMYSHLPTDVVLPITLSIMPSQRLACTVPRQNVTFCPQHRRSSTPPTVELSDPPRGRKGRPMHVGGIQVEDTPPLDAVQDLRKRCCGAVLDPPCELVFLVQIAEAATFPRLLRREIRRGSCVLRNQVCRRQFRRSAGSRQSPAREGTAVAIQGIESGVAPKYRQLQS